MRKKAKGTWTSSGKRKIAIMFDPKVFKHLADEAAAREMPFSMLVRAYISVGLKAEEKQR